MYEIFPETTTTVNKFLVFHNNFDNFIFITKS